MDKLEKQLRSRLLEDPDIQLKNAAIWNIPVITYEVTFKRVKRSQMDVLMKMMLLTFEEADIRRAANLSELLLVEELFIADLLKKMQRMGLIGLEKQSYKLTSKGQEQLRTGIMVEELEEESTELSYSPIHDEFWPEMTDYFDDKKMPLFRYANTENTVNEKKMLEVLAARENGAEEDGFQTVVEGIIGYDQQKVEHVPCLEFQLYNKKQDIFYARVWNTWIGRWDETLEKNIEEKEIMDWREKWMRLNGGTG
jgi:hypothetical protein